MPTPALASWRKSGSRYSHPTADTRRTFAFACGAHRSSKRLISKLDVVGRASAPQSTQHAHTARGRE